ncbi:MAG: PspC domain-containing protein [Acidobacteria bacterium]|nr:PspC domain-containing protein [Acidobacteriota bacterium]NIM61738.1 PspC domain-containing protein [Acidobacteriota bacterium]NIO58918.1 PspC domain-containing protein [Acidobacteriota bacterium]NIQ29972.1 PspC domain-containing protein [Acidobacteriota bacterium]NIQ84705.1 PspC domain-containing protein [Acidobacteriota bacterium]
MTTYKRIYRSRSETMIAGLAGGLANYFNVDPTLIRLAFVGAGFLTGIIPGLLAYVVGWIIVPLEPLPVPNAQATQPNES